MSKHDYKFDIPPDGCISDHLHSQIIAADRQGRLIALARRRRVPIAFLNYLLKEIIKR